MTGTTHRPAARGLATALAVAALLGATGMLSGCAEPPPAAGAAAEPEPFELSPAARLAARVALAQDQYYTGTYRYEPADGGAAGTARVERTRRGFLVELTEPASGTEVDRATAVVVRPAGLFHCRRTTTAAACVPVKKAGRGAEKSPAARLRLAFTAWLGILADHRAGLSVAVAQAPKGVQGTCFSVEGVTASLEPPVDPGLYCFDDQGRITALELESGIVVATAFAAAPPSVTLPAPVASGLPGTTLPPPSPSASASPSPG